MTNPLKDIKEKAKHILHKDKHADGTAGSNEATPSDPKTDVTPLGIANETAAEDNKVDSLDQPLADSMPPHIAQRLQEHREQFSK